MTTDQTTPPPGWALREAGYPCREMYLHGDKVIVMTDQTAARLWTALPAPPPGDGGTRALASDMIRDELLASIAWPGNRDQAAQFGDWIATKLACSGVLAEPPRADLAAYVDSLADAAAWCEGSDMNVSAGPGNVLAIVRHDLIRLMNVARPDYTTGVLTAPTPGDGGDRLAELTDEIAGALAGEFGRGDRDGGLWASWIAEDGQRSAGAASANDAARIAAGVAVRVLGAHYEAELGVELCGIQARHDVALDAEHQRGWEQAAQAIADTIERELICCDVYERTQSGNTVEPADHHAICYWGNAARHVALAVARGTSPAPAPASHGTCSRCGQPVLVGQQGRRLMGQQHEDGPVLPATLVHERCPAPTGEPAPAAEHHGGG